MSSTSAATEVRPSVEELIERNKLFASGYKPIPTLLARTKNNPKAYGPHTLIVSCLDSRANPVEKLSLTPGECVVIRNVAGRFATAASDIAALDTFFRLDQIILVHHTNCGASHITTEAVIESVRTKRPDFVAGDDAGIADLAKISPVKEDNDKSLREDLVKARQCGFIRKDLLDNVFGLWLDLETGLVRRVYPED